MQQLPSGNLQLDFLGKSVKSATSAKDLGIVLDSYLTFNSQITNLVSSCMAKLGQISRARFMFDRQTLIKIINSLVMTKLTYCSIVWSNTSRQNIKKLQLVQNFAARIVTNKRKYDHITPVLKSLEWLPIALLLDYKIIIMTFKCLNNLAPTYLCEKFVKRSAIHNRNTRHNDDLEIPKCKTSSGQKSFHYRATKLWNDLSPSLKDTSELSIFKHNLKHYLLTKFLYN